MIFKVAFLLFFVPKRSFGSFTFNDGKYFEDFFHGLDGSAWRRDFGARHCGGSQIPGGCVWTQKENLHYVQHDALHSEPWKSSELRISVRNDCEDDHCCHSDSHCTSYTSGQITSKDLYGYG